MKKKIHYAVFDKDHQYKIEVDTANYIYTVWDINNATSVPTTINVKNLTLKENTLIIADVTINGKTSKKIL